MVLLLSSFTVQVRSPFEFLFSLGVHICAWVYADCVFLDLDIYAIKLALI